MKSEAIKTEGAMILALRDQFPSPEYALLPQVRNSTGFSRKVRTADAVVMGLWPSRGVYLHGIEIKVSRADWLQEKKAPAKAEEICQYCDYWWLAAGSESIVQDGELPMDWGLLMPGVGGKLRVAKTPTKRADPTPVSRGFLAALLRKVTEASVVFTDVDKTIQERVSAEREQFEKHLESTLQSRIRLQLEHLQTLQRNVAVFEESSGIKIDRYSDYFSREIGSAVKAIRACGADLSVLRQFEQAERTLTRAAEDLAEKRKALEEVWGRQEAASC